MVETFSIVYEFVFPDNGCERFDLIFDSETVELVGSTNATPPSWTRLPFEQCPHCPFTLEKQPYCPVALNLLPAIEHFDKLMSYEIITVEVTSAERHVVNKSSAQQGLSSLMGLLIAGSSCPYTHFFKPMARFHLPFASKDETMWRAVASFLLARYFTKSGLDDRDIRLEGLSRIYNDIASLNDALVQRLRAVTSKDSAVNALVHLDVFAKYLMPPINDSLDQIKSIFDPYIKSLKV